MAEQPRATKPFAEEVRALLEAKDTSLRSLAGRIGVDPSFLVRVLQGKQPPSAKLVEGVTGAFELPADYFLEVRRETVDAKLSAEPLLVDTIYEQVVPERSTKRNPPRPDPGNLWQDTVTLLAAAKIRDRRLVRIGAAVLRRYSEDPDFRKAVDEELESAVHDPRGRS
jgi:transcriptional regulator with XRE-family HTH domain